MNKLYILEPLLNNDRGHYYENVKKIARSAKKANYKVGIYVNLRCASTVEQYETWPLFARYYKKYTPTSHNKLTRLKLLILKLFKEVNLIILKIVFLIAAKNGKKMKILPISVYAKELNFLFNKCEFKKGDIICFSTTDMNCVKALYELIITDKLPDKAKIKLMLPGKIDIDETDNIYISISRFRSVLLKRDLLNKKIDFFSENIVAQQHFQKKYGLQTKLLHVLTPSLINTSVVNGNEINITYISKTIGTFDTQILTDLIEKTLCENNSDKNIRFNVLNTKQNVDLIKRYLANKNLNNNPNVVVHNIYDYNSYKYHRLMNSTDIIFIPIKNNEDKRDINNLVADAISYKSILLTDKDEFPETLITHNNGLSVSTHEGYYESLHEILRSYEKYKEASVTSSDEYINTNNDMKYIQTLTETP